MAKLLCLRLEIMVEISPQFIQVYRRMTPTLPKDGLLWSPLIQINRKRFIPIDADLLLIGVWQRLAGGDYPAANGIISTRVGGHFTRMSETSMAAPHVSGGIATVMSAFPTLSAQTAAARLLGSASYDGLRTSFRMHIGKVRAG